MDEPRARLRLNLAQGEVEIEGSESFVARYAERFDALLARLPLRDDAPASPVAAAPPALPAPAASDAASPPTPARDDQHFGLLLQALPRSASDVDRILLAGYHVQRFSADKSFGTGEANALLVEQGIKVGNPSQCVKQNLIARRVFRHQRRYRLSQVGQEHLRQLLGPSFPG